MARTITRRDTENFVVPGGSSRAAQSNPAAVDFLLIAEDADVRDSQVIRAARTRHAETMRAFGVFGYSGPETRKGADKILMRLSVAAPSSPSTAGRRNSLCIVQCRKPPCSTLRNASSNRAEFLALHARR
jgi:hypothetical protein